MIGPGDRVLDIGSGWGGLGLYLAEIAGADVTGITLSTEQLQVANARAGERNLDTPSRIPAPAITATFRARSTASSRSACSSMSASDSMKLFFKRCAELLSDDGVMVLHSIRTFDRPRRDEPLDHQIHLPGRLHARPLRSDARNRTRRPAGLRYRDPAAALCRNAQSLARPLHGAARRGGRLYDERFARMWDSPGGFGMSFRKQNLMNFQIQLAKRQGIVPTTRDYITGEEARLRGMAVGRGGCSWRANSCCLNRGGVSSGGCKPRHKAYEPTLDGRVGRAPQQATDRHRVRHAVPGAKSLPSCQSASTATSAGRSLIAIPGFADPSPVLPVRYSWQLETRLPVPDFVTHLFCGEENHVRCDLLHRNPRRPVVLLRHGPADLPSSVQFDIRIDYAFIAFGVGAALFAFIYLILV